MPSDRTVSDEAMARVIADLRDAAVATSRPTPLSCIECGVPVARVDGAYVRGCRHAEAGIVAAMSASLSGHGGMTGKVE